MRFRRAHFSGAIGWARLMGTSQLSLAPGHTSRFSLLVAHSPCYGRHRSNSRSTPAITSVLNAASLAPGPFAPGSLITIRGTALADWVDQTATSSAFPFSIGDSTVRIQSQGSSVKEIAYLQYVSPMQINAQISAFLSPGPATLTLSVGGQSTQIAIAIAATGPGLFTSNGNATVLNLDGTVNSSSNAAPATSMITAFITGQGRTHILMSDGLAAPAGHPEIYATIAPTTATRRISKRRLHTADYGREVWGSTQVNITIPNIFLRGTISLPSRSEALSVTPERSRCNDAIDPGVRIEYETPWEVRPRAQR